MEWRLGQMNRICAYGVTRGRCIYSRWGLQGHREYFVYLPADPHAKEVFYHRNRQSSLSQLTPFLPIPKYFESEWSYAQYRIPVQSAHISLSSTSKSKASNLDQAEEEKCVVGWIDVSGDDDLESDRGPVPEYQLVALTYTGGWYRLSLPPVKGAVVRDTASASATSLLRQATTPQGYRRQSASSSASSRTEKASKGKEKEKQSRDCVLEEYRKYGRWDGWG